MFKRVYSLLSYQGSTTQELTFGVFDRHGALLDISSGYTCKVIADGVDRPVAEMVGDTLFLVRFTAAETAAMTVGCQDAWVIIENSVLPETKRTKYRIELNILDDEVADE